MDFSTEPVEIDTTSPTNDAWRQLMASKLQTATHFQIHCWKDEQAELRLALPYGTILDDFDWDGGTVVAGAVTPAFTAFLLGLPKPVDTELYNKMTPFFSIFLDNGFSSEHYGTELNQCPPWKS